MKSARHAPRSHDDENADFFCDLIEFRKVVVFCEADLCRIGRSQAPVPLKTDVKSTFNDAKMEATHSRPIRH